MNCYSEAKRLYSQNLNKKYYIYIRFNQDIYPDDLLKDLNRKSFTKDYGCDRNNSLSCGFTYRNTCKNFMLALKKNLKAAWGKDIREIRIKEIKD